MCQPPKWTSELGHAFGCLAFCKGPVHLQGSTAFKREERPALFWVRGRMMCRGISFWARIWVLVPGLQQPCVSTFRMDGCMHCYLREPGLEAVCELISGELVSTTFYAPVFNHADLCERLREACPSSSAEMARHVVAELSRCLEVGWAYVGIAVSAVVRLRGAGWHQLVSLVQRALAA